MLVYEADFIIEYKYTQLYQVSRLDHQVNTKPQKRKTLMLSPH